MKCIWKGHLHSGHHFVLSFSRLVLLKEMEVCRTYSISCLLMIWLKLLQSPNTLRLRQNGCSFADNTFTFIFLSFLQITMKGGVYNLDGTEAVEDFVTTTLSDPEEPSSKVRLRPSDAIWWQRTLSTLAQLMACCLTPPNHYLNQWWLIINEVQWQPPEGSFTQYTSAIND